MAIPAKITNPTLEFASAGVPRWYHVRGTKQDIELTFTDLTDISSYTITTEISEADTAVGEEPVAGTAEKTGGESRTLVEISKSGNTALLLIPSELGTTTPNGGGTPLIDGPTKVPQPGKPVYYYVEIRAEDTGIGDSQQSWSISGQIALQYSVIDQ